jgi:hypothetical protein
MSWRGVEARKGVAVLKQDLQKGTVRVHFWPRGRTMVETKKAREKSAGRWQRLHDLRSMRLLVPPVESLEELNQGRDLGIVEGARRE